MIKLLDILNECNCGCEQCSGVEENFKDGKVKGKSRPGRVKRAGASCKGSVASLRAKAKKYGGEKGKMYHWCANMKAGKSKKENVAPNHDGKAAPYGSGYKEVDENLRNWVKQKWVDISRKRKDGSHPPCGASAGSGSRAGGKRAYPKCVPASKARSMSKKDKESAVRRKRAVYKNKSTGAPPKKAKNVKTEAQKETKKDKCYYKVKARYKVWPSAYGSLALSKCRNVGAANWGEGGKKK